MIYNGAGDPKRQQWTLTISEFKSAEDFIIKCTLNPSWPAARLLTRATLKMRFSETNKQNDTVTANGCNHLFLRNKLVQHVK